MAKVVWYLHHYAGTPKIGMSFRPYYLAKELNKNNCNTLVVGASFHHLLKKPVVLNQHFLPQIIDDVPYLWVKTPKYSGNGFKRILNMLVYSFRLFFKDPVAECGASKPDVVIVSSAHPFHFFSAKKLSIRYGAKLIFEVRDIWPLSLIELLGLSKINPLIILLSWIEKIAYSSSDVVVSLLANSLEHMRSKGLSSDKFKYIPNGTKCDDLEIIKSIHNDYILKLKSEGKFIIVYTGAHGIPNALDNLIFCAQIIQKKDIFNIHFILVGDGIEKRTLKEIVKNSNIINVSFLDSVSKDQVPAILSLADVCYIGAQKTNLYRFGVSPNKLFDYMLAAKPVVFAIDSPNNPIELSGSGVCVNACNPSLLADEIIKLALLNIDSLHEMGLRGREFVIKNHDYSVLAKEYIKLF